MRRVLIFPLCLILTLIICSQAWGVSAWYVFKDGDTTKYTNDSDTTEYKTGNWSGTNTTDITSLKEFFSSTVQANDVVYMKADTFTITETITLTKNVYIYGGFSDGDTGVNFRTGNTTISGGNSVQVIKISNIISVLLDGLTITGGKAAGGGGVGVEENSTVTINNCTITGNTATNNGGGVRAYDKATLTMTNCTIKDNTANNSSGGGGGVYVNQNATATMTNCTITGNKATNNNGGGVYAYQNTTLTMTNCTIAENEAKNNGGGLYATPTKLNMINCTIANNKTTATNGNGNGKEIYNSGTVNMINSFVWNSTANKAIDNGNNSGKFNASYCAFPRGLNVTGITPTENENITITSWSTRTSDNVTVNGVTHTVYKIEENTELSELEGKGTSIGAPEKDQIGNKRASPPCIGAVEKVNAPVLSPAGPITINAIIGKAITTQTITATTGLDIVWSATGKLPAGLTATSADNTCTISGVPETGTDTNSQYNYKITATNSEGSDDITVNVNVFAVPMLSYSDSLTLTEGETMSSFTITAIAGKNLTWSSENIPSGLTTSQTDTTFTISGTPAIGSAGSHTCKVTATNTAGTTTATITITITAAAAPALLDEAISYTAEEGSEIYPIRIIATSGKNLTWSDSGKLPEGLEVSNQDNVFTISGTPAEGTASSTPYTYTVKAANIAGNKEAQVTITVNEESPPVAPVLLDSEINYTGLEGWEISPIRIIAKSGNKFTWSESGELPDGLKTLSQGNIFTIYGTPGTGTAGSYTYTVKAANSLGNDEAKITITIKSGSSPAAPVLLDSAINYTGLEGWEISQIRIIATSGNNLEWSSSGTLPNGLQVSSKDNVFTIYGTPGTGTAGSYTYSVKAGNSLGSAEAKITITIKTIESGSSPAAPVLLDPAINYTGLEGWEISPIRIIATAGNNLEWSSSGTLPNGLQVSSKDNVFTIYGTPGNGTAGSYTYTVKAVNSLGSAEAKINITIKESSSSSKPVLSEPAITYTKQEGYTIEPIIIKAAGYNLAWSLSGTLPDGLSGTESGDNTGYIISGAPAMGTAGKYSCTVTAKNDMGEASTLVTIIIEKFELEGLYEPSENTNLEDYLLNSRGLSREQLYAITSLKVFPNITSLDGIDKLMPNLKTLDLTEAYSLGENLNLGVLGDLDIDEINISGNPVLKALTLNNCNVRRVNAEGCENLVSIEIAGNESIEELILDNTNITEINAVNCKNLRTLHFANSRVSTIDLTGCDELQDINFRANRVRRFHKDQFGLGRLEKLNAGGQRAYVPLIGKVFNFAGFLLGHDIDYEVNYSSVSAAQSWDKNLDEVIAYNESGSEIDYDDSKYEKTGEFIFDEAPAKIIYEYETGLTSMDVTITGTPDDDNESGFSSSGGCSSGLAHGILLALMWLVFEFLRRLHFFMMRKIFVVLLALLLVPITSSQARAASAWYVINDNGTVKYTQDSAATDYQAGKWSSAASTADSLANFFANTVQADDIIYMRADEFTIANPVGITKNLTVYGGFKNSDSSIDSRTGSTTIKGGTNFKGSIITSNSGNVLLDGLTITGGNGFKESGGAFYDDSGGGVHHGSGTLTITNCIITGNTAKFGGGVFNYDTLTMTNCTVSGNKATDGGGGIYNRAIQTITNCVISDNTAEIGGGGIDSDNNLTMTNCTVSGNSSFHGGGVDSHGFVMTMTNCTIFDNKAKHLGGGVYNTGEKLTMINCTVTGNSGYFGPEIANDWGLTIKNSLVWDNSGQAVYNYDASKAWINASYCAFPSGLNVTGIKFNDDSHNIAVTSWNTRAVHEAEVDGVTHNVFEIEINQELASLESAGTSDGAPEKDQIGRIRSNPPCIGAADTGKSYVPLLNTSAVTINASEDKSITVQAVKAVHGNKLTWSISGPLPKGLTGSASENNTSYIISGKPSIGTAGSYSYTLTAKNDMGQASTALNINVSVKDYRDIDKMTKPEDRMTLKEYLSDYSPEQLAELTDFKVPDNITNLNEIDKFMPKLKTLDLTADYTYTLTNNLDLSVLGNLQLEKVNLSGNFAVKTLNIKSCDVKIVNAYDCQNIKTIDVAGNNFIEELYAGKTSITEMNARGCSNLKILHFPNASVSKMDLTGCSELRDLDFHDNHIKSFNKDDFGLDKLEKLDASGQKEEASLKDALFSLFKFITGNNNSNNTSSADAAVSNLDIYIYEYYYYMYILSIKAYDAFHNEIGYDDSKYEETGEITFDMIPAMIVYNYDTGFNDLSMDVTISIKSDYGDYDYGESILGSSSGGCNSSFASVALLVLSGLAFIHRRKL